MTWEEHTSEWSEREDDLYPDEERATPPWRRRVVVAVAVLAIAAMALVPLYNTILATRPPTAGNGLEVCGFDYCIVHDHLTAAGFDTTMSRLSTTYLGDDEAQQFADQLVAHLGLGTVPVRVVDDIAGRSDGFFDPSTRSIVVLRPVRAWTLVHEVAHVGATGHGEDFLETLTSLAAWLDSG